MITRLGVETDLANATLEEPETSSWFLDMLKGVSAELTKIQADRVAAGLPTYGFKIDTPTGTVEVGADGFTLTRKATGETGTVSTEEGKKIMAGVGFAEFLKSPVVWGMAAIVGLGYVAMKRKKK